MNTELHSDTSAKSFTTDRRTHGHPNMLAKNVRTRVQSKLKLRCIRPEFLRYSEGSPCIRKLNRLLWVEGTCLESYGVRIGIRASQAGVVDQLTPFLPPRWEPIEPPRRLDSLFSWVVGGEHKPNVRAFDVMYEGIGRIARTLKPEEVFDAFERHFRMTVALHSRRFVFIHAGVVGWRGRAIVMPGPTFTGKSTLVEALTRAGAEYFSDEYAVLDSAGRVHPFEIPISLRMPGTLRQEPRAIQMIGGRTTDRSMKVGAILITRYREGAISRFRNASPGQGSLELVANAIAARCAASRVLRATRNASKGAVVLRGFRGEAEVAVKHLLAVLDGCEGLSKIPHGGVLHGIA